MDNAIWGQTQLLFFFKVVHDTNNWKNVLLTLSLKHQQLLAYHLDSPNLFKAKLIVEKVKVVTVSELDTTLRCVIERKCPHLERVSLSKSVQLHGTVCRGHDFIFRAVQWPSKISQDCNNSDKCTGSDIYLPNNCFKVHWTFTILRTCWRPPLWNCCLGSKSVDRLSPSRSIQSWWETECDHEDIHPQLNHQKWYVDESLSFQFKCVSLLFQFSITIAVVVIFYTCRLQLEGDFILQYEDPDFANALCQLTEMSELPEGRAVLHIVWNTDASPPNLSDSHSIGSVSSLDTASLLLWGL